MLRNGVQLLTALQELRLSPQVVSVRWRRKPRWFPVAPSKKFRIPKRPEQDPAESVELLRLHNIYRTHMRAIRVLLAEEVAKTQEAALSAGTGSEKEEIEHARCMALNDEWNRSVALVREQRLEQMGKERAEQALKGLAYYEAKKAAKAEAIEKLVTQEKEQAGTYITAENLDAAIEQALETIVDYNYCIDLEGNITYGRAAKPEKQVVS